VPFERILGNRAAHERLGALVTRNRVAHAFLFAGPAGIGKRMAALEFAKLLLGGSEADVRQVDAGHHPNLRLLARIEDKREIVVDQMRELLRELSMKTASPQRRIVLVDEAERLNEEAQNAFLKTLEEPPHRCIIILVTASPALLLPTIVSRCQMVLFTPLAPAEMSEFMKTLQLGASEAALVLALADGLPGRASQLAPEIGELASRAKELLERLAAGDLNSIIEEVAKIRDTESARERAREELTITALALREALRHRELGESLNLCPPALLKRLEPVDSEAIAERIELVLEHQRFIDQYANVPLTVEDALLRV